MPASQFIAQASFDGDDLGRVLSIRLGRSALLAQSGATPPRLTAEVRTRSVDLAEELTLGRQGDLVFTAGVTEAGQAARQVIWPQAAYHLLDVQYEQSAAALAVLHFVAEEPPAAQPPPPIAIDEEPLPCDPTGLAVGSWKRHLIRRELPGLDGEVVLDMGLRGRPLAQVGRLRAATAAAVYGQAAAMSRHQDGRTHSVADTHGVVFRNVLMLSFELTTPVTVSPDGAWADYKVEYLQLP